MQVKQMLRDWEKRFPGRIETLFRSLAHVVPSHLMDGKLHDFLKLQATGVPDPDGDTAFDPAEFSASIPATGVVSWPT
jgi:tRNA 2-thiocytidine biosynthesis protein TtcA